MEENNEFSVPKITSSIRLARDLCPNFKTPSSSPKFNKSLYRVLLPIMYE